MIEKVYPASEEGGVILSVKEEPIWLKINGKVAQLVLFTNIIPFTDIEKLKTASEQNTSLVAYQPTFIKQSVRIVQFITGFEMVGGTISIIVEIPIEQSKYVV